MKDKKVRAVKSLHLLFIGELFVSLGLLSALDFIYDPLAIISLLSIVGIIITFVGIIKLAKVNKFFFISFICVCLTLLFGILSAVLTIEGAKNEAIAKYESLTSVFTKIVSMIFTFGIIRGCSKAATGKANTKFANIMTIVNFSGKFLAILFLILQGVFFESNETAASVFAVLSLIVSIGVEVFFVIYLYRAYNKAKNIVAKKKYNL